MAKGNAWKVGEAGAPPFPDDFEIRRKAVLQKTDIASNNNKYYAVELHVSPGPGGELYRVFTHYGRTDDLMTNPDAGQKECRFFDSLADAEAGYISIYRQKTGAGKGYKELSLASSRIGSQKARGQSSGEVDEKTLQKLEKTAQAESAAKEPAVTSPEASAAPPVPPVPQPPPPVAPFEKVSGPGKLKKALLKLVGKDADPPPPPAPEPAHAEGASAVAGSDGNLSPEVRDLVSMIYAEATAALTQTVQAQITAQGIETPLGILTVGQIEKGEAILQELYALFQKKKVKREHMVRLSGEFYTMIPHRIGRTRATIEEAVIDSLADFEAKQETLQLMKDMLQVNGEGGVLFKSQATQQYEALRCDLRHLPSASEEFQRVRDLVERSQIKTKGIRVRRVFGLRRPQDEAAFEAGMSNQRPLFHGSRIKNWVGILSRGILLPKIVVSMGVNRTDAGWLGNGLYFGDAACTSAFYTTPGRNGTRLLAVARVGLGRVKDYTKITYGLNGPPEGFDSCHGVRKQAGVASEFADDEYVVYRTPQQKLEYLVEFTA